MAKKVRRSNECQLASFSLNMISVITPTRRPEGLKLVEKALKRQTFRDFEWIVVAPCEVSIKGFNIDQLLSDPPKKEGNYWTVYAGYNKAVKQSKGELVVSWQDWTYADPDALQRFWDHYQAEPKTLVTGVGNKYTEDTFTVVSWKDPRERGDLGSSYPCYHNDIEWNFCAVPKASIYSVGGFDEYFDKYSSLCGLDVLSRLNFQGGWNFKIDQSIKSYSLEHGRMPNWEESLPFNGPWQEKLREYSQNYVLEYLK